MDIIYLHEKIWYYPVLIQNTSDLLSMLENTNELADNNSVIGPWKDWFIEEDGKKYQFGQQKTCNIKKLDGANPILKNIFFTINNLLYDKGSEYLKYFNIKDWETSEISISKYFTGKQMGPHTDSYKDQDNSLITVILYLNDNYEGGDLFFPEQNLIIKPQSGSIIVFPSTFPFVHESKKIINGHKYIASMFWVKNESKTRN